MIFKVIVTINTSIKSGWNSHSCFSPVVSISRLFNIFKSDKCEMVSHCSCNLHTLRTGEIEIACLFIRLLAIWISSPMALLPNCPLFCGLFYLFLSSVYPGCSSLFLCFANAFSMCVAYHSPVF